MSPLSRRINSEDMLMETVFKNRSLNQQPVQYLLNMDVQEKNERDGENQKVKDVFEKCRKEHAIATGIHFGIIGLGAAGFVGLIVGIAFSALSIATGGIAPAIAIALILITGIAVGIFAAIKARKNNAQITKISEDQLDKFHESRAARLQDKIEQLNREIKEGKYTAPEINQLKIVRNRFQEVLNKYLG